MTSSQRNTERHTKICHFFSVWKETRTNEALHGRASSSLMDICNSSGAAYALPALESPVAELELTLQNLSGRMNYAIHIQYKISYPRQIPREILKCKIALNNADQPFYLQGRVAAFSKQTPAACIAYCLHNGLHQGTSENNAPTSPARRPDSPTKC